jgi:hypothetical protein
MNVSVVVSAKTVKSVKSVKNISRHFKAAQGAYAA